MFKSFHYKFEELNVVPDDLFPLLGFEEGSVPDPFPLMISRALEEATTLCDIRGGYRIFDSVVIDRDKETITILDKVFSPSRTVVTQLKSATSAALFLCTAGDGISYQGDNYVAEDDPVMTYLLDVIGSVTVDKAMDHIQKELFLDAEKRGLGISDRYSPGYCEWSVAEQHQLFSLLEGNALGISLSPSALMSPIKSVSGIVGIGAGLRQKGYQCEWCTDKNCIYGKIKRGKKISPAAP